MIRRHGFSLVELMIVVAIIGILAAIAVPNYIEMQWRAKRVEIPENITGIKQAVVIYEAAHDEFLSTAAYPSPVPGKEPVEWIKADSGSFRSLGWAPDGKVRGQYKVEGADTDFTIIGQSDIDGNGHYAEFQATSSSNVTMISGDTVY